MCGCIFGGFAVLTGQTDEAGMEVMLAEVLLGLWQCVACIVPTPVLHVCGRARGVLELPCAPLHFVHGLLSVVGFSPPRLAPAVLCWN